MPAAAIAFPRTHPSIINVTLGARTRSLWDTLRTQGLIRSDVLTGHGGGRDERCL